MASMYNGGRALLVTFALLAAVLMLLLAVAPAGAQTTVDYDANDNRLIEIGNPAQLNAIRYDLDGDGTVDNSGDQTSYDAGFANAAGDQCPAGCQGYELTADLNLAADYANWTPIGGTGGYSGDFDGHGYAIRGLNSAVSADYAGLFSLLASGGLIRNVAIISPTVQVTGGTTRALGGLVGYVSSGATVHSSFVAGGVITLAGSDMRGGGLAGRNNGTIRASYSTAAVTSDASHAGIQAGGLLGRNSGALVASYAAGAVSATTTSTGQIGGLIGRNSGSGASIANSHCSSDTGQANCIGLDTSSDAAARYTAAEMKAPTGYAGIYANWNIDLSTPADGVNDDPWDFVDRHNYPLLKVDKDGNGTPTWPEFSGQSRYIPPPPPPPPYNWRADHPESYANARTGITATCAVMTTGEGDDAVTTSTITFDLADYTRPITLALSLWDRTHFRSLQSLGLNMPALQREGQTATVEVVTDPARTRFRLDGQYGLNLVLGYADCHTDDS